MKSKRLISLLLSAALAVSSVPMMMATAVSAADIDVGYEVVYGGDAYDVDVEDGNKYLHIGNRLGSRNIGTRFDMGALEAGTYYISFDARISVVAKGAQSMRVYCGTRNNLRVENQLRVDAKNEDGTSQFSGNSLYFWIPTSNCEAPYGTGGTANISIGANWLNYELKYQIAEASPDLRLDIYGSTSECYRTPFDIDNFAVYTYEESENGTYVLDENGDYKLAESIEEGVTLFEKVPVYDRLALDFDEATKFTVETVVTTENEDGTVTEETTTSTNGIYLINDAQNVAKVNGETVADYGKVIFTVEAEDDYVRVEPVDNQDVSLTYDIDDIYLAPGNYTFSTEMLARYGKFWDVLTRGVDGTTADGSSELVYSNSFGLSAVAVIDGKEYALDGEAFVAPTEWTALGDYTLDLPVYGTLEEIIFTAYEIPSDIIVEGAVPENAVKVVAEDGTVSIGIDDSKCVATPIHFKNVETLTVTQNTAYVEIYYSNDDTNLLNGVDVNYNGEPVEARETAHLYIPERILVKDGDTTVASTVDTFFSFVFDGQPVEGRTYYLGFKVRSETYNGKYMSLRASVGNSLPYVELGDDTDGDKVLDTAGYIPSGTLANGVECSADTVKGLHSRFAIPSENCEANVVWSYGNTDAMLIYPVTHLTADWQYVEYFCTPEANNKTNLRFDLTRGPSTDFRQALHIDDLVLYYYDENGDKVVIHENDFDNGNLTFDDATYFTQYNAAWAEGKGNADYELKYGVAPSAVTVAPFEGENASVTYDLGKIGERTGAYTFTATVASETEGTAYVAINGEAVSETVTVTAEGAELAFDVEIASGEAIETIEIVTDIAGAITVSAEHLSFVKTNPAIGDTDGNDKVTPLDLTWFARYLASWKGYASKIISKALDIDGDGEATMLDATMLARHIANWKGYEVVEEIGIHTDAANDTYVFTNGYKTVSGGIKSAYELGLPVAYGELYRYTHSDETNGFIELDGATRVDVVYSPIKLGKGQRVFRIDENNVVYAVDELKVHDTKNPDGIVDDSYNISQWLTALSNTSTTGWRDYAKYGITDVTGDKKVNYNDYLWYIDEANNTLAEGAETTAVEAKRNEFKAQLVEVANGDVAVSETADFAAALGYSDKGYTRTVVNLLKALTDAGVEVTAENIVFEDIPTDITEVDLCSQLVTAEFVEVDGEQYLTVKFGSTTIIDADDKVTDFAVVNNSTVAVTKYSEEPELALAILTSAPQVAIPGGTNKTDAHAEFLANSLKDGLAVFIVGYTNEDK